MKKSALAIGVTLTMVGCNATKDPEGTSKSEIVTDENGENVRKMTIRLMDGTLSGVHFPDDITITAQALDASDNPIAAADGSVDIAVTYKPFSKWLYRQGEAKNNYADIHHFGMLEFNVPLTAAKWKLDTSKIPDRTCAPEPAVSAVVDVPDVTDLEDKKGSEFAVQGNCKFNHVFKGKVSGLKGTLKLSTKDSQEKELTSEDGAELAFDIPVAGIAYSETYVELTAAEIESYNGRTNFNKLLLKNGRKHQGIFAVTVATQPEGQTCTITNGSKTYQDVWIRDVDDIQRTTDDWYYVGGGIPQKFAVTPSADEAVITCADNGPADHSVGGSVTGLNGSLTIALTEPAEQKTLTADGDFQFTGKITAGSDYEVTIATQPAGQTCTLANATGTIAADVSDVTITCADNPAAFTLGGTVTGLPMGESVKLQDFGAPMVNKFVTVTADGAFQFPGTRGAGYYYQVDVIVQPTSATCVSSNDIDTLSGNVTNIMVVCTPNLP